MSESAATYVSILETSPAEGGKEGEEPSPPTAFSLKRFIPLLKERIWVLNPFTRTFLVGWITLLDSIPDLELVTYLPEFLGGLLRFLGDPNKDVQQATQVCLDKFLAEIKRISQVKKGIVGSKRSRDKAKRDASLDGASLQGGPAEGDELESVGSTSSELTSEDYWVPGQDVQINYPAILEILTTTLNSSQGKQLSRCLVDKSFTTDVSTDEAGLREALRWIAELLEICPQEVLPFTPQILTHLLPAMASPVEPIRQAAVRVNTALMDCVMSLADDSEPAPAQQQGRLTLPAPGEAGDGMSSARASLTSSRDAEVRSPTPAQPPATPSPSVPLDYGAAVNALTLLFLNDHEATRVAALTWLLMLHRKAPRKVLASNDGTFPALLKTLSDPSEAVITKDLQLLSQISKYSEDDYFSNFMVNLLQLFATDRKLLEFRGNLIIRQLCVSLSAERIYRTLADCIEKEEDIEFASIMVQNLNNNLITAPELAELRKKLRNLDAKVATHIYLTPTSYRWKKKVLTRSVFLGRANIVRCSLPVLVL